MKKKTLYIILGTLAIILLFVGCLYYAAEQHRKEQKAILKGQMDQLQASIEQKMDCVAGCGGLACEGMEMFYDYTPEQYEDFLQKARTTREEFQERVNKCAQQVLMTRDEIIKQGESSYWEGYEKLEDWDTLINTEFRFMVDVPKEWKSYSDPTTSLVGGASKGMIVSSGEGAAVRFAINTSLDSKPIIPTFHELDDNDKLIEEWGNAFKYFRGVYSNDEEAKDDDLIIYHPIGTDERDFTYDNFISIDMEDDLSYQDLQQQKKNVEKIKEVIKSFRRY